MQRLRVREAVQLITARAVQIVDYRVALRRLGLVARREVYTIADVAAKGSAGERAMRYAGRERTWFRFIDPFDLRITRGVVWGDAGGLRRQRTCEKA